MAFLLSGWLLLFLLMVFIQKTITGEPVDGYGTQVAIICSFVLVLTVYLKVTSGGGVK